MKTAKKIALYIALVFVVLAFFSLVACIGRTSGSSTRPYKPTSSDSNPEPPFDTELEEDERQMKYFEVIDSYIGESTFSGTFFFYDEMTWNDWYAEELNKKGDNFSHGGWWLQKFSPYIMYGTLDRPGEILYLYTKVNGVTKKVNLSDKMVENGEYYFDR